MSKSSRNNNHEEWSELKQLLLQEETARLEFLEKKYLRPEDLTTSVGEVLSEVVDQTPNKQRLSKKLYPVVEDSLYRSVQKDPGSLADAIYPVMAPAIRKSINEALQKVTESVNSSLNSGLSVKNLGWRLQAMFSGLSYGEIVLKNSLLFQVQELYLIHNETGLLISHISQKTGDNPDGDMISGMLTAIRDFVSDSFQVDKGESLETIQVGDLMVMIEQGPHASLACVLKGDPTTEFRGILNTTVEKIHQEFGPELNSFEGDTAGLEDTEEILRPALVTKLESDEGGNSKMLITIAAIFGFVIFTLLAYNIFWGIYWGNLSRSIDRYSRYEVIIKDRKWHNYNIVASKTGKGKVTSRIERKGNSIPLDYTISLPLEDFVDWHLRNGKADFSAIDNSGENKKVQMSRIDSLLYEFSRKNLKTIALSMDNSWAKDSLLVIQEEVSKVFLFFKVNTDTLSRDEIMKAKNLEKLLSRANTLCEILKEHWVLSVYGSAEPNESSEKIKDLELQRSFFAVDQILPKQMEWIIVTWNRTNQFETDRVSQLIDKNNQLGFVSFELKDVNEP